ncbi:MAG: HPr kinase/phosphorylase [Agrobacterium sp.]|nr:HPr kinase/phosphorylase [Agrobacterium sp.]
MNAERFNLHATAIVVDNAGILFTGPSGKGQKGDLRLSSVSWTEAQRCGLPAALIADDQIFVYRDGENILAERPEAIAGLLELRGSGIVKVNSVPSAVLHFAVTTVVSPENPRLPEDDEHRFVLPWRRLSFRFYVDILAVQLDLLPAGKICCTCSESFQNECEVTMIQAILGLRFAFSSSR